MILTSGDMHLVLAPEIGGSIAAWTRGAEPLFRPSLPGALDEASPRGLASYPLFPYSNRVAGRRFTFAGVTHDLPDLMNGFAIHGAGWQRPWTAAQDRNMATLTLDHQPGPLWPFAFHAEQRFTLLGDALVCDLRVENRDTVPAPAGFGLHPYFPRSPRASLQFTATHVWHNGADMIPTELTPVPPAWDHRDGRPVGSVTLDNCFAGWSGHARLLYPDRGFALSIAADPVFRHLVVYVPPGESFLAVEPVSNMNDGLNRMDGVTDHGVFVLAPGEARTGRITFRVEPA
ncbi:aldose 1-epimerase [Limobrevibacterium gyesilva]|uniref:Aldose 1-epimerase n=1 Tax=Limobrevibacterium gyesilva TaxID=2991712 RepID=A0AA41YKU6_9PROT|nr:aldose 1-epimerase [Limobrevibacterium gyesilva]MCW3474067.1 aldose 1-epimerase [Limobrevibacterium gyesilva]